MMRITKIFHFEMAHAIYDYKGLCKNIHGHSYILHVSVSHDDPPGDYYPAPGFAIDFKSVKKIVQENVITVLDHALLLSRQYTEQNPAVLAHNNLIIFEAEPTAENILFYIKKQLQSYLPEEIRLEKLLLFETADSYAEWVAVGG